MIVKQLVPAHHPEHGSTRSAPQQQRKRRARSARSGAVTLEDAREFLAGEREGRRLARAYHQRGLSEADAVARAHQEVRIPAYVADSPHDDVHEAFGMGLAYGVERENASRHAAQEHRPQEEHPCN